MTEEDVCEFAPTGRSGARPLFSCLRAGCRFNTSIAGFSLAVVPVFGVDLLSLQEKQRTE